MLLGQVTRCLSGGSSHVWCESITCSYTELQAPARPCAGPWASPPSTRLLSGRLCHLNCQHKETGTLSPGGPGLGWAGGSVLENESASAVSYRG